MEALSTGQCKLDLLQADITQRPVDAIVNAANNSLLGGGGVDGAIHRAAGPELLQACRKLNGCPTGEARITPGFQLPARYIIHTVGPVWHGGKQGEAELLANCYRNSLALAEQHQLTSLAFPAISCGVYGYPPQQASEIALNEILQFLPRSECIERVELIAFSDNMLQVFHDALHS
ncbi:MAG TPA: O-acetyl-ADP-ribose deacetylase [Gammaproteobacteria bacterium]